MRAYLRRSAGYSMEEARLWDLDRRTRLVETDDPAYFTLADFRQAMTEAREERRDEPAAQRILDQLDAWILEIGLENLAQETSGEKLN